MDNQKREPGIITTAGIIDNEHGGLTFSALIKFDGGGCQGFGYIHLPTVAIQNSFVSKVCGTFNVNTKTNKEGQLINLIGLKCNALRCFDRLNEPIEGLESVDTGKRMTINAWRKENGYNDTSVLESRRQSLYSDIDRHNQQIRDCYAQLAKIDREYTDWDVK